MKPRRHRDAGNTQLLPCLKLSRLLIGYIVNFNVVILLEALRRRVN